MPFEEFKTKMHFKNVTSPCHREGAQNKVNTGANAHVPHFTIYGILRNELFDNLYVHYVQKK